MLSVLPPPVQLDPTNLALLLAPAAAQDRERNIAALSTRSLNPYCRTGLRLFGSLRYDFPLSALRAPYDRFLDNTCSTPTCSMNCAGL